MKLWEIIRIYNGIQRRYRVVREEARMLAYIYTVAHIEKESDKPDSVYDYLHFPWDPVKNPKWKEWMIEEHKKLLNQ